jgi:hypothetical protein
MRRQWRLMLAALIVCAVAAGAAGFAVAAHRSNVSVVTGTFHVGDHEASAQVDGFWYGIVDSVSWLDSNNSWHQDGWPACLGPVGTMRTARFGYTEVDGPTSISWRQVVWVSCLS